jgi:cation transport ATPase
MSLSSPLSDAALQRRAMVAMLLAMLVMALGLPLHLATFRDHSRHTWLALPVAWLSCFLTLSTLAAGRHALSDTWRALRYARLGGAEIVTISALITLIVSLPSLVIHSAPMYFDVTAMALAWHLTGAAQSSTIQRRFAATVEQLAPLNLRPQRPTLLAADHEPWLARWLLGILFVFAIAALLWHSLSGNLSNAALAALAVAAAGCPCTLGIVRSSAWAVGAERAVAIGWLIPVGEAWSRIEALPAQADQLAVRLGAASSADLRALACAVQRTIRWNTVWSISLNLALLPLALAGPVPAILPAATMVLARLLIGFTTWRLARRLSLTTTCLEYNPDDM